MGRGRGFEVAVDHYGGLCEGEGPGQASRGDDHGDDGKERTMAEQEIHMEEAAVEEATVVWRSMVRIAGRMTMAKPVDWETEVEPKELETKVEP